MKAKIATVTHSKLKAAIIAVLNEKKYKSGEAKVLYPLIAEKLGLQNNEPAFVDTYEDGRNKFEINVQAAVEDLRKKHVIVRGGTRGVWTLK